MATISSCSIFLCNENLIKKIINPSLMSTLIGLMIANAIYDILPISNGILIVAGILTCLGLGLLFPNSINEKETLKKPRKFGFLCYKFFA